MEKLGCGCGAAVEYSPYDLDVEDLILAGRWLFPSCFLSTFHFIYDFSFIINHRMSLVRSLKEVHLYKMTQKVLKNEYLAELPRAKHA